MMNRLNGKVGVFLSLAMSVNALAYDFGSPGSDGSDGYSGRSGDSGRSAEIFARGQSENLNLDGSNGTPGGNASPGGDAYSCSMPYDAHYNLTGADGGDGGQGGNGGQGGDSGSLTVYFDDIKNLLKIYVSQVPGSGASGGQGASGGEACSCSTSSWTVRECNQVPVSNEVCSEVRVPREVCRQVPTCDRPPPGETTCDTRRECTTEYGHETQCHTETSYETRCSDETYYCSSGSHGSSGRDGYSGSDGSVGSVYLIPQLTRLPDETKQVSITIDRLIETATTPIVLVENLWSRHSGARYLFASGSSVNNQYQLYDLTVRKQVSFEWKATGSPRDFAKFNLALTIQNGRFRLTYDSNNLWLTHDVRETDTNVIVTITGAMDVKRDVKPLEMKGLRGRESQAVLVVADPALRGSDLQTTFHLRFEGKTWFAAPRKVLFEGTVPASAIRRSGQEFLISLSALGIENKFLKRGKNVHVTLKSERRWNQFVQSRAWSETKYDMP